MSAELSQRVYDHLCRQLLTGELAGGDKVSELAVAKQTGVSRSPVREAMVKLAAEGMLDRVPKLGAFVRTPGKADIAEFFGLREWLEAGAAATLARQQTPPSPVLPPTAPASAAAPTLNDTLAPLLRIHEDTLALARELYALNTDVLPQPMTDRLTTLDNEFHLALMQATGNAAGLRALVRAHMLIRMAGYRMGLYNREHVASIYTDHDRVLRAIRRGDATEAHSAMAEHVQWSADSVRAQFEKTARPQPLTTVAPRLGPADRWPDELRRLLEAPSLKVGGPVGR